MKKYKKVIGLFSLSALIFAAFFVFTTDVFAASYSSNAPGDASILNNPFGQTTLTDFFEAVMEHLQGIIAFLAIVFIVIGGIMYITAGGNQKMVMIAKSCIVAAIIGLTLAAAGPSFLKQIKIATYGDVNANVPTDLASAPTMQAIIARVLSFLLSVAGMLAIIGLTISGLMYLFALGDSAQAENAKRAMKYSIIGVATAGAALIIVRQIVAFFS